MGEAAGQGEIRELPAAAAEGGMRRLGTPLGGGGGARGGDGPARPGAGGDSPCGERRNGAPAAVVQPRWADFRQQTLFRCGALSVMGGFATVSSPMARQIIRRSFNRSIGPKWWGRHAAKIIRNHRDAIAETDVS